MSGADYVDFDPDQLRGRSCTVQDTVHGDGLFKRQIGGRGKFGHVRLSVSPHPSVHGYRFVWPTAASMALPQAYMREACLRGAVLALREPTIDGRQVVCVAVTVTDGSYHEHDSDDDSFERASYMAVRDALRKATLAEV